MTLHGFGQPRSPQHLYGLTPIRVLVNKALADAPLLHFSLGFFYFLVWKFEFCKGKTSVSLWIWSHVLLFYSSTIHPFSYLTEFLSGSLACRSLSCLLLGEYGVDPGQVACLSQGHTISQSHLGQFRVINKCRTLKFLFFKNSLSGVFSYLFLAIFPNNCCMVFALVEGHCWAEKWISK